MDKEIKEIRTECQLQVVYESAGPLQLSDKIRNFSRRIVTAFRRRLPLSMSSVSHNDKSIQGTTCSSSVSTCKPTKSAEGQHLQEGDLVEVLSHAEIQQTLDDKGRSGGLEFMAGMDRFTGQRFTVLKNVRTIFDERAWKMVRVKNTVILKDVLCDGRGMFDKEGCDRCCYFFWKERWLRKVD